MVRILIADDDPSILELIHMYLSREGYSVHTARDGKEAFDMLSNGKWDLIILDVMMPHMDGWQLTQDIRRYYGDVPILLVTAKGESEDKIKGFRLGTDDYLAKPFVAEELVMRVKALLRRYRIFSGESLSIGNVRLDASTKEADTNGSLQALPAKEFDLLYTLAGFPGQIFTRDQLIEKIWGHDYDGDERTVDVHIKRLRDRFTEANGFAIQTIRGIGYRIEVK
ncbi:Transcriptional regulatory protein [Paenibacillus nuruki]|uniref:Heme response regulator HssR n=1 Tax=Paenibacillus nuruki TaxID=1886670 RepID=A0A1E3L9L7_9BACL|nr:MULTISPECIES: response regulator transcription factor [Paenibacillus]ODP30436.1 Transcriptional regulatory protein [Paenibacillus nuruki]TKJ87018.1 DNA-binding response regulator [Paenibacillus sp. CFBP13512]